VRRRQRVGVLTDGIASEFLTRSLVETITNAGIDGMVVNPVEGSGQSSMQFAATAALQNLDLVAAELEVRTLAVEQSNSSVILGERAVLKMLRRLFPGRHPEVDMSGALTEGGFTNTAPLLGYVYRKDTEGTPTVLAVLQGYIPNQGNGWEWVLERLERYSQEMASLQSIEAEAEDEHAAREAEAIDTLSRFAEVIGTRLGEMHHVLSTRTHDPAFAPVLASPEDCLAWAESVSIQIQRALDHLDEVRSSLSDNDRRDAEALLRSRHDLLKVTSDLAEKGAGSLMFRIHGDLHLGQILVSQDDAYFIDFEGEPMREVSDRSDKASPYRDVAGIVRSFHYATATAAERNSLLENERVRDKHVEFLEHFHQSVCDSFLKAYKDVAVTLGHRWQHAAGQEALIKLFTLEKAAYEITYEATNRPAWIRIPLQGLMDIVRELDIGDRRQMLH
jgi:maltose alpha-D-glucosyltransferase/alpha-amylase